jgi:hypothetical protein
LIASVTFSTFSLLSLALVFSSVKDTLK